MLRNAFQICGLVGILRGLPPSGAVATASTLYDVGFRVLEVPLNSPSPLDSIGSIRKALPEDCRVGAGTVFRPAQVKDVQDAGGEFIVMPHCDPIVIQAALRSEMEVLPGVATPSEAFAAYSAGARLLKVFPAADIGVSALRAWGAVLPEDIFLVPVGGITAENMRAYDTDRTIGFGAATALYAPSMTMDEIRMRGEGYVAAWQELKRQSLKDAQ